MSVEQVARACLARIARRNPVIHAWETIDSDAVLTQARALDRAKLRSPLHGIPVGVKDVIDTVDLPTQMGSSLYTGYQPRNDAACVAQLRSAGALILGKTVTAEFAGTAPTKTRNPHNIEHTPGGSSSGSAAAVADHMVPIAIGTQTGGSVLRPAAFCGVVGFKPSFGSYNRVGVKPAAESLDTIGLIAREIDDIELVHSVLTGATATLGSLPSQAPRIGVCRTHLWDTVAPETIAAIEQTIKIITNAGGEVNEKTLPGDGEKLTEERIIINSYERARALAHEWFESKDQLSEQLIKTCERGFRISGERYIAAQRLVEKSRLEVAERFTDIDALLTPTAPGEAPRGFEDAGDPRLQELWTLLHLPSITLPTYSGPNGLPVGIQLIAARHDEAHLCAIARWVSQRISLET